MTDNEWEILVNSSLIPILKKDYPRRNQNTELNGFRSYLAKNNRLGKTSKEVVAEFSAYLDQSAGVRAEIRLNQGRQLGDVGDRSGGFEISSNPDPEQVRQIASNLAAAERAAADKLAAEKAAAIKAAADKVAADKLAAEKAAAIKAAADKVAADKLAAEKAAAIKAAADKVAADKLAAEKAAAEKTAAAKLAAAKAAAVINLKNGTVGMPYETQIEKPKEFTHTKVQLDSVFADIGLTVTSDLRVTGSPTKDGTHKLIVTFSDDKGQKTERDYKLVVNPDPKSLWKKIEPQQADKDFYDKAHSDTKLLKDERGLVLGASLRGRSHEHEAKFREDDFRISLDKGFRFIVVSDGAGSAKYSRIGSQRICEKAHELLLQKFMKQTAVIVPVLGAYNKGPLSDSDNNILGQEFYKIFTESAFETRQFLEATVEAFKVKHPEMPFALKDFAGTLLMLLCLPLNNGKTILFSFGIGDGAIGYVSKGEAKNLYKPDSGEFSGQTVFLVTPSWFADADKLAKRMKIEIVQDLSAVMVMTDGVSDPVFETENGLDNPKKWQDLWEEIKPHVSAAKPEEAMLKWLEFWSAGNHDDRTIVVATTGK